MPGISSSSTGSLEVTMRWANVISSRLGLESTGLGRADFFRLRFGRGGGRLGCGLGSGLIGLRTLGAQGRPAPHARDEPFPASSRRAFSARSSSNSARSSSDNGWDSSSAIVQPFLLKKAADTMSAAYQIQGWRRRESNPRPLPCDGSALPTELRPQDKLIFYLRLANCQRPLPSLFGTGLF